MADSPYLTSNDLAELQSRMVHLMEAVCGEEDEAEEKRLLAELDDLYETLTGEVPSKLLRLRAVAVRTASEIDMVRKEEKLLAAARKSRERLLKNLKGYMQLLLGGHSATHGATKIKAEGHTFWLATTKSLDAPEDVALWPDKWTTTETVVKADKSSAFKALKGGDELPGFGVIETTGIRWR